MLEFCPVTHRASCQIFGYKLATILTGEFKYIKPKISRCQTWRSYLLLYYREHEPCSVNVNFKDFVALVFFGFAQNVLDCDIVAVHFSIDDVFELDFSVYDYVKFTHFSHIREKWVSGL